MRETGLAWLQTANPSASAASGSKRMQDCATLFGFKPCLAMEQVRMNHLLLSVLVFLLLAQSKLDLRRAGRLVRKRSYAHKNRI